MLNKEKNKELLNTDEQKQKAFGEKIPMAKPIKNKLEIPNMIDRFFNTVVAQDCWGWTRSVNFVRKSEWKKANEINDLNGEWYHVHLRDNEQEYIRIGTVRISQVMEPDSYKILNVIGHNYGCIYKNKVISYDSDKPSTFRGEYDFQPDKNEITGVFLSERGFEDREVKKGLHRFSIIRDKDGRIERINGTFQDAAPSARWGDIHLFKTEQERDKYLIDRRFKKKKTSAKTNEVS